MKLAKVILKSVGKRFGDFTAVHSLDLEIEEGQFMVLVGPSGCGKTTLLRMVAGLEEVSSGEIWIGDRIVNDVPPKDRDIAMVFQNYALYPHMDVYNNMAFGLKLRHFPKSEINERVERVGQLLGITNKLKNKPKALSGGQRQRVALGRAIVRDPQVFLFDEPLSNLDAKLRVRMRAELQALHRQLATTTIYVTHDQVEAMTLGQRVAVMKDGVLQQVDQPQRLYEHPQNVFVAGFLGSPAMNFLNARLVSTGSDIYAEGEAFKLMLTKEKAARLSDHVGREVIVGIRPEDFKPRQASDGQESNAFPIRVRVVEPLGPEQIIYGDLAGSEVVVKLEPNLQVPIDQELVLSVNTRKLHLFDRESERSLEALAAAQPAEA